MLSIVTYGRNDNYSFNLVKRTAMSFNCLAEVLTEQDEILFVDYNTPDHLPTLPESIWDTLTDKALKLVKVIRISRDLHEVLKGDSVLPVLENISRNAAIVRSNPANHWILSTNPDVLLVLSSRWQDINELLLQTPDSFYEMPRFDIPESVWSSLYRSEPKSNMTMLRDWIVANQVAVVETVPDWQFQKFLLFDAPGDFQLAPRDYFFRLRGFDESMNKYLHSDSNLAKRMWMLNGCRTDHLLGNLWVLHQDHYLSGEWTKNFTGILHNHLGTKVSQQNDVIANDKDWGLQDVPLPTFSLLEKVASQRTSFFQPSKASNGDLPLNREPRWHTQSVYRTCHYDPTILALYLRESLHIVAPKSHVAYLGHHLPSLNAIQKMWKELSPSGAPVCDLRELAGRGDPVTPGVLLVDCYFQRSEYWDKRIRLVQEQAQRRLEKGRITEEEALEKTSDFTNSADYKAWEAELLSAWTELLPSVRLRPGAFVILLGCSVDYDLHFKFMQTLAKRSAKSNGRASEHQVSQSQNSKLMAHARSGQAHGRMGLTRLRMLSSLSEWWSRSERNAPLATTELRPLYVHHRLVVSRVEGPQCPQSTT